MYFMRIKLFIFLTVFIICQTASLYDGNDDDSFKLNNRFRSLTPEQFAELDEFLSRELGYDKSSEEELYRHTRRPNHNHIVKRDALWTTTEVLDCIRRLKLYKNQSKLDLVTEMLNCYRRLKHAG